VLRGGSWINNGRNCRSAYRNHNEPDNRDNNNGFRVVLAQLDRRSVNPKTQVDPESFLSDLTIGE
jgi:hypothetical protein